MKKLYLVLILILLVGLLFFLVLRLKNNLCKGYSCLYFPNKDLWKVKEVYTEEKKAWRGLISAPEYLVRLDMSEVSNVEDAQNLTNIGIMRMKGLFENAKSPYPGDISDEIVCGDKYKPVVKRLKTKSGIDIDYLSVYLNKRMQTGICVDNQIEFNSTVGFFYCHNTSEHYQLEIITSKDRPMDEKDYKNIMLEVKCQLPLNIFRLLP